MQVSDIQSRSFRWMFIACYPEGRLLSPLEIIMHVIARELSSYMTIAYVCDPVLEDIKLCLYLYCVEFMTVDDNIILI